MAGAAALLCFAQVIYVAPEILAYSSVPAAVRSEPTIHLFDANVQFDNPSMAGYIEQLRTYRPDVVALEETKPWDLGQFMSSGVFDHLPYRFVVPCHGCGSRGFIIASRYPLGHPTVLSVHGLAYLIRCSLTFERRTLPFWIVHTTPPIKPNWNDWNLELNGVYCRTAEISSSATVDGRRLQCLLGQSRFPRHSVDGPDRRGRGTRAALCLHVESAFTGSPAVHTNRPRPDGRQPHGDDDKHTQRTRK